MFFSVFPSIFIAILLVPSTFSPVAVLMLPVSVVVPFLFMVSVFSCMFVGVVVMLNVLSAWLLM